MPSPYGPMTLGEITDAIDASYKATLPEYMKDKKHGERSVYIDWNRMRPTGFYSYRGYYNHLACGFDKGCPLVTVDEFLKWCRQADGETYSGWKGGDYTMGPDTPVWIAESGESCGWGVSGIRDVGYAIIIETRHFD